MNAFEQLEILRENISTIQCPVISFLMSQRARELEEEIERIKSITVYICQN
jgi:hypothetical protein